MVATSKNSDGVSSGWIVKTDRVVCSRAIRASSLSKFCKISSSSMVLMTRAEGEDSLSGFSSFFSPPKAFNPGLLSKSLLRNKVFLKSGRLNLLNFLNSIFGLFFESCFFGFFVVDG